MRKTFEALGVAALAFMFWITWAALHGSQRLPGRIPTHFAFDGQPNAWGSPAMLLFLPLIAAVVYAIMSVVALFPAAFNYPVRVTPENRPRLQAIALSMISSIKVEMACLFAWIQWSIIRAARQGSYNLPPVLVPLCIAAIFATIVAHIVAMVRAGRAPSRP